VVFSGVSKEWAWIPGKRANELELEEEMRTFGVLENPFSREYIDFLLMEHGFHAITHYHQVNGVFTEEEARQSLEDLSRYKATDSNDLVAIKIFPYRRTTADPDAFTLADIKIDHAFYDKSNRHLRVKVTLRNMGESVWLNRIIKRGYVTLAVRQGRVENPNLKEASDRKLLPKHVLPNEQVTMEMSVFLPETDLKDRWEIDLVNEGVFWFSQRGTICPEIILPLCADS
jgi:hypothetical protein